MHIRHFPTTLDTMTALNNHMGNCISTTCPASNSFSTSFLMISFFSAPKRLNFCYTGLTVGSSCSILRAILGSIPFRSYGLKAKTSAFLLTHAIILSYGLGSMFPLIFNTNLIFPGNKLYSQYLPCELYVGTYWLLQSH